MWVMMRRSIINIKPAFPHIFPNSVNAPPIFPNEIPLPNATVLQSGSPAQYTSMKEFCRNIGIDYQCFVNAKKVVSGISKGCCMLVYYVP